MSLPGGDFMPLGTPDDSEFLFEPLPVAYEARYIDGVGSVINDQKTPIDHVSIVMGFDMVEVFIGFNEEPIEIVSLWRASVFGGVLLDSHEGGVLVTGAHYTDCEAPGEANYSDCEEVPETNYTECE